MLVLSAYATFKRTETLWFFLAFLQCMRPVYLILWPGSNEVVKDGDMLQFLLLSVLR